MSVSQTDFTRAVLDPSLSAPPGLSNPDGAQASKRFDVYRNNVTVSLINALSTAFPAIAKILGEENFKRVANVYLRQHPPTSPLLMFYGAEMPEFLADFEPVKSLGYLPDLARLELALRRSYHAEDASSVSPETFQSLPADQLMASRLRFAPSVMLERSRWPVEAIWRFQMEEGAPEPSAGGQNVLVTRPEFDPVVTALPPGGGTFVATLMKSTKFANAVDSATEQVPDFDLTQTFGILIAGAAITELNED